MTKSQAIRQRTREFTAADNVNIKFARTSDFQIEIRRKVDEFFRTTGRRERDCPEMYLKTAILISSFIVTYTLLVFVAQAAWQSVPLAILLGGITALIGFNIQHDGGHRAYSNHEWVNRMMATSLDVMGGSSHHWRWKHGVFHHTYVNITDHDTDIDLRGLGRLTPHQKRRWYYRWQQFYIWLLYGLLAVNWHMVADFRDISVGRIGNKKFPRPRGWDLVVFFAGKVAFFSVAFGIPLLFHPFWVVVVYYVVVAIVLGIVLSVVFQVAHCVEQAEFPLPKDASGIENAWAIHQVETTVDFARGSRIASWLLGGLNFQIEHHLFPRICHIHYPAISKLVEETCHDFGVKYSEHDSLWTGLVAHFRWMRQLGLPEAPGPRPANTTVLES